MSSGKRSATTTARRNRQLIPLLKTTKIEKYVLCGILDPGQEEDTPGVILRQVSIKRTAGDPIECTCSVELLRRIDVARPVVAIVQHDGGRDFPEVCAIYNDDVDPATFRELERRVSEILGGTLDD